jgi:hypothetical protein
LVALASRLELPFFGLLVSFDIFFWNFDLVPIFGVAKLNFAEVPEFSLHCFQYFVQLVFDDVYFFVCLIEALVDAWSWFGHLTLAIGQRFPYYHLFELVDSLLQTVWEEAIFTLGPQKQLEPF